MPAVPIFGDRNQIALKRFDFCGVVMRKKGEPNVVDTLLGGDVQARLRCGLSAPSSGGLRPSQVDFSIAFLVAAKCGISGSA